MFNVHIGLQFLLTSSNRFQVPRAESPPSKIQMTSPYALRLLFLDSLIFWKPKAWLSTNIRFNYAKSTALPLDHRR